MSITYNKNIYDTFNSPLLNNQLKTQFENHV
jgi:hypothetical protein